MKNNCMQCLFLLILTTLVASDLGDESDETAALLGGPDEQPSNETSPTTTGQPLISVTTHKPQLVDRVMQHIRKMNGQTIFVQTAKSFGENIVNQLDLLAHADLLVNISQLAVEWEGLQWRLPDLCVKPPIPPLGDELEFMSDMINPIVQRMIPCIMITPMDCFWDGAKPLGPDPPINMPQGIIDLLGIDMPAGETTWKNLNPKPLLDGVTELFGDIEVLDGLAILEDAYQARPCIDNLDPDCPSTAPNAIDFCRLIDSFMSWNATAGSSAIGLNAEIVKKSKSEISELAKDRRRKRQIATDDYDYYADMYASVDENGNSNNDNKKAGEQLGGLLGSLFGGSETSSEYTDDPRPQRCRAYLKSMRQLLREQPALVEQWIGDKKQREKIFPMSTADFLSKQLHGGCKGLAPSLLHWSSELIMPRPNLGLFSELNVVPQKLQSIISLAGPNELYKRFKVGNEKIYRGSRSNSGVSVPRLEDEMRLVEAEYNARNPMANIISDLQNGYGLKPTLQNKNEWSPQTAAMILDNWQLKFSSFIQKESQRLRDKMRTSVKEFSVERLSTTHLYDLFEKAQNLLSSS